jgi:hypothetical protein
MLTKLHMSAVVIAAGALLAGCAENSTVFGGSNNLTTASVVETPKTDPACLTLASQIDGLKKEGVADKVAQASVKKYKMTQADLGKADQLNRANTEFQSKCSTVKPSVQAAAPSPAVAAVTTAAAPAVTAAAAKAAPSIAPAVAKAAAAAQ